MASPTPPHVPIRNTATPSVARANVVSIETLAHRIGDLLAVGGPKDVCLGCEGVLKKHFDTTAARDGEAVILPGDAALTVPIS